MFWLLLVTGAWANWAGHIDLKDINFSYHNLTRLDMRVRPT